MLSAQRAPPRSISLKALLAVALAAMALFSIAAVGVIAERALRSQAEHAVKDRLANLVLQTNSRFDRSMFGRYRDMLVTSALDVMREGSHDDRRAVLEELQASFPDYAWIGMTDAEGRVVAATGGLLEGADVSSEGWFVGAQAAPYVGDVREAPRLAEVLPRSGVWPLRVVDVAAPVRTPDGRLVGVLGAQLNWEWALGLLDSVLTPLEIDAQIDALILDRNGEVLLGPAGFGRASPCPLPAAQTALSAPAAIVTCANGRSYAVKVARSPGYRAFTGLGWQTLVRQPSDVAFAAQNELRRRLLVAGLVLAAAFAGTGVILASVIARPLRQVALGAERIRAGDRDAQLPQSSNFAEVVSLVGSLDGLIGGLRDKERALTAVGAESDRRERFLGAILAQMQDAVLVARNDRVIFANPACLRLFGAASEVEMLDRPPVERFDPAGLAGIVLRLTEGAPGSTPPFQTRVIRLDGRAVDVEATAAAFRDGGADAIVAILRDVSARRLTERQLAHAQRMEAVGHLTGGMAHDFNNLLTVIIGNLELLQPRLAAGPDAQDEVDLALAASLRGAELTRQLLAFSRRQTLDPKPIGLNALVEGTARLLGRTLGERIEVRLRLGADLWPAMADPAQLESALTNLAINARDAMPTGGVLSVETANTGLDAQYAAQNPDVTPGDYVMLAVSDTGSGMPPEVLDRVFEPFFTTKLDGKGSGLGLSMVYGFAKQSRGHIKIYSESGHGTTVRIYLPRAEAGAAAVERAVAAPVATAGGGTVLVVEDKPDVRQVVARQIASLGYRVIEAGDPAAAIDVVRSVQSVDLLFTDIVMPGGMTGVDLAGQALLLRPGLKVVFTSGFADVLSRTGEPAALPGPLLSKPYRMRDLAETLRRSLGRDAA